MSITALSGPVISFGQAPSSDNNPMMATSLFFGGVGLLDPRPQFSYAPGTDKAFAWLGGGGIQTAFVIPATKSATLVTAAVHTVSGTAMALASSTTTGLAVGVKVPRQDTGASVTCLELDPLVASVTANVTSGSNILTVTAVGSGSCYNPLGLCPGIVLTDATHASAIPSGATITGFLSGGGGTGTYTMSANAASSQTGDTVTGLYTAFPHANLFGTAVNIWNPTAMCTRTLLFTCNSASGVGGTFTINGLDVYGFPMTETVTIAPASALTIAGLKAWKYIYSITPGFTDATYTYSVGTNDVIGFPIRSDNFQPGVSLDVSLMMNNAAITATTGYIAAVKTTATATTGDVRGTYALQTSANGTLAFSVKQDPLVPNVNSAVGLYGVSQYTAW